MMAAAHTNCRTTRAHSSTMNAMKGTNMQLYFMMPVMYWKEPIMALHGTAGGGGGRHHGRVSQKWFSATAHRSEPPTGRAGRWMPNPAHKPAARLLCCAVLWQQARDRCWHSKRGVQQGREGGSHSPRHRKVREQHRASAAEGDCKRHERTDARVPAANMPRRPRQRTRMSIHGAWCKRPAGECSGQRPRPGQPPGSTTRSRHSCWHPLEVHDVRQLGQVQHGR